MATGIRKKPGKRKSASISMAPMIDMVFLLLIFFMTASAMSQAGSKLELELPESEESEVPQDLSNRLIVSVAADGRAHLGRSVVDDEELRSAIEAFRERAAQGKLSLRADQGARFEDIKRVMKIAADAGVESYLYATIQSGE